MTPPRSPPPRSMRVMVERVAVMALMALAIIANFRKQYSAAAVDASFVSAAGSLILGQWVLAAFLPSTPVVSYGSHLMVAMFFLSACVGFDGALKDWNDHTYTAHNRLLRVLPQVTSGSCFGALVLASCRLTIDLWEPTRVAIMTVATVMLVVAVLAMHANEHGAEHCFQPGCTSPALFATWAAAWLGLQLLLTPQVRLAISERAGLGLHAVFGLRELNSGEAQGLLRQVTRAEAAAAKARMTRTLEAALNNAVAMRAAATREWREEGLKRRALHALAQNSGRASAVGARLQREQKRQHPSPRSRVRLMRDGYAAEAEARLLLRASRLASRTAAMSAGSSSLETGST